jgi:predicted AlkP superfamily pyrophosphatase or phosphodiesterase
MAVVSDHGHITADREVHLNAALRERGLIDVDGQGKVTGWRAFAWTAGGSAAIVLREPGDAAASQQVDEVLQRLQREPGSGIARVLTGDALQTTGGFAAASFVVDLKPGFRTGNAVSGAITRPASAPGGNHGYLPGPRDMESAFFIAGHGVPAGRSLGTIDMRDIAPTLAAKLGVTLPRAQGRNRF